ncbi:MAG: 1-acyl-sn-glycerol-3-phosphate acyltransferase [Candidatus Nanopelagicales bacterium]
MVRRFIGAGVLKATGWRVTGPAPSPDDTRIFVGAPHTSGFDSVLMLAVAWSNDLRIRFLIKREVVDGPFGFFWRSVGAIPVDRDNPAGLIDELVHLADSGRGFQLVLTPEGTRKPVDYWKSGFYRLAQTTGIPLILVAPDGPTKVVTWGPTFAVTGDVRADMDRVRAFFADKRGVDPSKVREPRLRAEEDPEQLAMP